MVLDTLDAEQTVRTAPAPCADAQSADPCAAQSQRATQLLTHIECAAESVRAAALRKAAKLLQPGTSPEDALAFLANAITNKLMHPPTASLRDACLRGDHGLLQAAQRLFARDAPT